MGPAPEEDTAELDGGNGTLHITIKDIERWIKVLGTKHRPEAKLAARQLKEINQGLEFLRDGSLDIEAFRNQARGLSI
jgi:hypothetical protein